MAVIIPVVRRKSHWRWLPLWLGMGWLGVMGVAGAEEAVSREPAPPPDEIRSQGHALPGKGALVGEFREDASQEIPGPETVIRLYEDAGGNQVREFVINGFTFQIEVLPYGGIPYYLLDTDGDGLFEVRTHADEPRLVVPQWILFRF